MFDSSSFSNQLISINEVTKYGYSSFDGNKGVNIRILKINNKNKRIQIKLK